MGKFGKYDTGGEHTAPPIPKTNEMECDHEAATTGTTTGQPDTKPAVNPKHP